MAVVVIAFDRGLLDRPVHPFDLPVGPGMLDLGQLVFDVMLVADPVEDVVEGVFVVRHVGKLDAPFDCPPAARAQQPYWVSGGIAPWYILLDDSVCDDEEFSNGGGDGEFWRFAFGAEALVEVADGWIKTDDGQGCHIEGAPNREPAAGNMRLTAPLSAVTVHGSDAGKGCDLLFVSDAEFREFGDQYSGRCGADAWNGFQQNSFARERIIGRNLGLYARITPETMLLNRVVMDGDREIIAGEFSRLSGSEIFDQLVAVCIRGVGGDAPKLRMMMLDRFINQFSNGFKAFPEAAEEFDTADDFVQKTLSLILPAIDWADVAREVNAPDPA